MNFWDVTRKKAESQTSSAISLLPMLEQNSAVSLDTENYQPDKENIEPNAYGDHSQSVICSATTTGIRLTGVSGNYQIINFMCRI